MGVSIKKSFAWSAVEEFAPKAIQFTVSILLARMLSPSDFGLLGMLALFIAIAGVFADSGLSASLIQQKEISNDDETSVFYINISLGIFLALLLCATSPWVAAFYNQKILVPLLCFQSISLVTSSFGIVQRSLMTRAMEFRKMATITLISTMASGAVGIGMAYSGFGVWSLAGSMLAASLVKVSLSWRMNTWRPRGAFSWGNVREIWKFSSFLLYCQLIGIFYQNMYSVVIGKFYSVESLGYYNRANTLHLLPATTMAGMIGKVAFPLFSRYQDDKAALLIRMRELIRVSLIFSAAGMALLALIADPLIPLLMTDRWAPSIPILRILCYSAMLYPISAMFLMVLQSQGHSKLNFRLESIKMVLGFITLLSVWRFGVIALAWSVVGMRGISYFINVWYHVKLLNYRWRSQAFDILPTFALCGVAALVTLQVKWLVIGNAFLQMGVVAVVFLLSIALGIGILRNFFFADIWRHGHMAFCWVNAKFQSN